MNLRQIIQNQKLQNFDLISLVSEADEEVKYIDKEGKTKTMAIAPALRLVDPKHPARVAAEKLRGSQEDPKKKAAATTTSPNTTDTQDPEGKDFDDELDDFMGGDEEEEEETEELSEKDKEEIRKINDSLPESIRGADPSVARALHYGYKRVPPSPAGQAGKIWTPAPGNASSLYNETVSMIGAELLKETPGAAELSPEEMKEELRKNLEERLGHTAAWKDITKEGHIDTTIDAAINKYNMTREAMIAADIDPEDAETKSYYGTAVSLQNQYDDIMNHTGPFYGGNGQKIESIPTDTETRMFLEDFKDPDTGEKLSEEDINKMLDNPNDPEVIKRFLALSAYNGGGGGNPSDTATIITDGDKMQFIAFSDKTSLGDQQANSTPNQLINNFFGTIRILKGDGYEIDPEEEKEMNRIIEEKGNKFKEAENNLAKAQSAPFNVLAKLLSDKNNEETKNKAKELFDKEYQPPDSDRYKPIKKLHETLNDNPDNLNDPKKVGINKKQSAAMKEAGIDPLPTWDYYLKEVGWEEGQEITPELVEAAYIARAGDSREYEDESGEPTSVGDALTSSKQQRYIADAIKGLRKSAAADEIEIDDDDREAVVNQQRQIEKYRQESIDALNEMHDELNKITVKNEKGEESRMGDTLMAMDMIRALHLGMVDKNDAPGLFNSGSVHIVAGKHRTSPEAMKKCLGGIDNTDDLVRNTRTRPVERSGPQLKSGLYESELSRSTKEKATNDAGENLYIVDGRYVFSAEKPKGADVQGPLGVITGRKVFAYTLDEKGEEIPIGEMSMRTKGGTTLQTTYTFANDLKKCLEKESGPTNESLNALLGDILAEEEINTLAHHWKIAEDDYPVDLFIKELNERSLN